MNKRTFKETHCALFALFYCFRRINIMEDLKQKIVVRPKRPEDIPEVQQLLRSAWLATYPNDQESVSREDIEVLLGPEPSPQEISKAQESARERGENPDALVGIISGRVVGFLTFLRGETQDELKAIYVDPEYKRKGIGAALWSAIVHTFTKPVIVRVVSYNKNAIAFYEKLGFVDTQKTVRNPRLILPLSGKQLVEKEFVYKKYEG